jgi:hypothetical protein
VAAQDGREDSGDQPRPAAGTEEILTVLRVRGIGVPDAARQRIQAEEDSGTLERWLERAVIASSIGEVIDDPN